MEKSAASAALTGKKYIAFTQCSQYTASMRANNQNKQGLIDLCVYAREGIAADERIVEIGSYAGESLYIMSGYFTHISCVDPWTQEAIDNTTSHRRKASDIEKMFDLFADAARNRSGVEVVKYKMESKEAAELFENESIGLVYLDGDHSERAVEADITLWREKVRPGGFISGHDYGNKEAVGPVVDRMLGVPDQVFVDHSWIKRK